MTDTAENALPKLNLYALYGTSEEDAENGKWFSLSPTIRVKLRRLKSKKSRKVRERLEAPYKRLARSSTASLPTDVLEQILTEQLAEAIIVDWEGFTDREGNPVAYSKEVALKLLIDLPELRDDLASLALSMDNFRDEEIGEIEGN